MGFLSPSADRVKGDLAKWASARLDAGPERRAAITAHLDKLLDALWVVLPPARKAELLLALAEPGAERVTPRLD